MINKEQAKTAYIEEELNSFKGYTTNEELRKEARSFLIENNLIDEVTEELNKRIDEYTIAVINPMCDKLLYVLKNRGNLRVQDREEIEELINDLKEKDKKFIIRSLVLENFFKSEGLELNEEAKIELTLKLGALDFSDLSYFDEDGYLV